MKLDTKTKQEVISILKRYQHYLFDHVGTSSSNHLNDIETLIKEVESTNRINTQNLHLVYLKYKSVILN